MPLKLNVKGSKTPDVTPGLMSLLSALLSFEFSPEMEKYKRRLGTKKIREQNGWGT